MPRLFKYIPEEYVKDFVSGGIVLFRSLSYFRDYEDSNIRGDEFEGTRVFCPPEGLRIHNQTQNTIGNLNQCFESTANEDDIFAFCMSQHLKAELFDFFKTEYCIEILKPHRFLAKLKHAILPMEAVTEKFIVFDTVHYYSAAEPPIVDWALPERIALLKPEPYSQQYEVRAAFAVNGAFRPENVKVRLVARGERRFPKSENHPEMKVKLGNLSSLCRIWKRSQCA